MDFQSGKMVFNGWLQLFDEWLASVGALGVRQAGPSGDIALRGEKSQRICLRRSPMARPYELTLAQGSLSTGPPGPDSYRLNP